jgi:hypothetical protein
VHYDNPVNFASSKIDEYIQDLRSGLEPETLAYWYKRIEESSKETAPEELKDKIHFVQDRLLWMKFKLDISKRAVPFVLDSIEENISLMPYSTELYFRKIQEILIDSLKFSTNVESTTNKNVSKLKSIKIKKQTKSKKTRNKRKVRKQETNDEK